VNGHRWARDGPDKTTRFSRRFSYSLVNRFRRLSLMPAYADRADPLSGYARRTQIHARGRGQRGREGEREGDNCEITARSLRNALPQPPTPRDRKSPRLLLLLSGHFIPSFSFCRDETRGSFVTAREAAFASNIG